MIKVTVIAYGNKMPDWVNSAVKNYSKNLREFVRFTLVEIPLIKRHKGCDLPRLIQKESLVMHAAIPNNARIIALAIKGDTFSSEQMALKIEVLLNKHSHLCFIIGGPEGLSEDSLTRCQETWSLSPLTLPHPLVRVLFLEALYRGFSILNNHPYHR